MQKKDDETDTPSKRFFPFWDYLILAIYTLAFIIIYCSFFDKGELQNNQYKGLGTAYRVIDGDTTKLCPIYSGQ